ncbi:aminotransferase class III-fold pyridoxal phosphate-dependent enzyme [Aliikangiella sp. IMCC44359]|uniref:aminotransferase class III-fold pyridoxal phosphate-dependent enzyme n=1 Tax=Aliikangiella sp. IMCC44359 TaxID=3459125 RepID=UPI00403AF55F
MFIKLIIILISIYCLYRVIVRLRLSRAKHPSLRGHAKWSRRLAKLVPYFSFNEVRFFSSDGAPEVIAHSRKMGLERLKNKALDESGNTFHFLAGLQSSISDVAFTSAYRVPFPYREYLCKELLLGSVVEVSDNIRLKDIDGNWRYDLSGSYGVNVFGYDFYKSCLDQGILKVKELGPVLGPYHPVIKENVEKLKIISGLDEVSFHMSGTEAVMQAVRLARYHTGKTHLVRFCGAYHGWWDGVQPGIGNQRKINDVYTLSDLSNVTLKVLQTRHDIACVLINPLQAFHPNSDSSSDATLIASTRSVSYNRKSYAAWLRKVRAICSERGIVLIFDEIFTGFRLGYRGAQEYFDIQADMVTYGKTLGGGLPVGVVCGRHHLMKRFKDNMPANISFARGTFNSHPYVMGTMNEFLHRIEKTEYNQLYSTIELKWNERVRQLNEQLNRANLPVEITNMHTVLTVLYKQPSRYNWMLQFYLRANGIELAWIGTGRMIMSFTIDDEEFNQISQRFIAAVEQMKRDNWWWQPDNYSNKIIKRQMLKDILRVRFPILSKLFITPITNSKTVESTVEKVG